MTAEQPALAIPGQIAARAEHRRQRRDTREATYKEFIDATEALATGIPWLMGSTPNSNDLGDIPRRANTASSCHAAIRALRTKTQLAGSEPVARAASEITTTALLLASSFRELEKSLDSNRATLFAKWWLEAKKHHRTLMKQSATSPLQLVQL